MITVVGFGGGRSPAPSWTVVATRSPDRDAVGRTLRAARVALSAPSRRTAHTFWALSHNREMYVSAKAVDVDVWVANDWATLPIGARLAAEANCTLVYDSHEYASKMGADQLQWRLRMGPYIRALEARYIGNAAEILTVTTGIARLLQADHRLPSEPSVVRNVPPYQQTPYRAPGASVKVLFHGVLSPNRNLEAIIDSTSFWPTGYELIIRGSGPRGYERHLRAIASRVSDPRRIRFADPVAMTDLIASASEADIGIHAINGDTEQTRYSLPNKLFEYVMAGLAICVTDLPEMSSIVRRYGIGKTFARPGAAEIGRAIASFSREEIAACKRRSLDAARELCWEKERGRLLHVFNRLPLSA